MKLRLDFNHIKGDVFGGITAGIVALPLALAFGVQSGLGAAAGLYGAMILGFFAAIFGGTKTQISGPTGPMTVLSATLVSTVVAKFGDIDSALGLIILTFLFAGFFQVIFGFLKIGQYIKFIPYPVLSGFMSGIGVIIIILQVFPAMGLLSPTKITNVITNFPEALVNINYIALAITLATIITIYTFPKITNYIPSTLVALIVITIITYYLNLDVPLIGEMPNGLPELKISSFSSVNLKSIGLIIIPAITLAGLGTIDTLLTSVVADNITRTKHNSNKELIGQGIGNMLASLFGGLPGAGATMRTVVNIKSGGKTRISGIIHAFFLLLIVLGLSKLVAYIPLAVLAGILFTVGISIIDVKGLKNILKIPRSDSYILIIVLFLTVFVDLLKAVGIGMVMASIIFMRKASEMVEQNATLRKVESGDKEIEWEDEKSLSLNKYNGVYIKRLDGPVFFGVASKIMERVNKIPSDAKVVIFRMKRVPYIDQSGMYALEEVIKEMQKIGVVVVFTMLQDQPKYLFLKNKFIPNIIPEEYLFESIETCTIWLKDYCNNSIE